MRELHHGTVIALGGAGALIRGPSGAGKSDLALRCLDHPAGGLISGRAVLVADDQVWLEQRGDRLVASTPETIRGLIEARGMGIVRVPFVETAVLALVVDLVASDRIDRLPDAATHAYICGMRLPLLNIPAFEGSSALKVLLALERAAAAQ